MTRWKGQWGSGSGLGIRTEKQPPISVKVLVSNPSGPARGECLSLNHRHNLQCPLLDGGVHVILLSRSDGQPQEYRVAETADQLSHLVELHDVGRTVHVGPMQAAYRKIHLARTLSPIRASSVVMTLDSIAPSSVALCLYVSRPCRTTSWGMWSRTLRHKMHPPSNTCSPPVGGP